MLEGTWEIPNRYFSMAAHVSKPGNMTTVSHSRTYFIRAKMLFSIVITSKLKASPNSHEEKGLVSQAQILG